MLTFTEWMETMYRPLSGAETPPEGQGGEQQGQQPAQAAPAESGAGEGGGESAPDPMAPLMERMDEMGSQIKQIAEGGQQQGQPQGDPAQQQGFMGYDAYGNAMFEQPGAFDPGAMGQAMPGPAGAPQFDAQQAQQLAQLGLMDPQTGEVNEQAAAAFLGMGQQIGQTQQQFQQLAQQMGAMRLEMDAGELEAKYPELQDPEKGEAIVGKAVEIAQQMGNPMLAQNKGFIELVYQAGKASEASAGETPAAGQQGATLESAAGAGAPPQPPADLGEEIVNAGTRGDRSTVFFP